MGKATGGSSGNLELIEKIKELEKIVYTSTGQPIPNGSDLNDIKTPGKYRCTSAANAQTLANCPNGFAFSMYVEPLGFGDWIRQTWKRASLIENYERVFSPTTNTWGNWKRTDNIISDIKVKSASFGSNTVPANSSITIPFELEIDEEYTLLSREFIVGNTSNTSILFNRSRIKDGGYVLDYRNIAASEQTANFYVYYIEIKK